MKNTLTKFALGASLLLPFAFAAPALAATDWDTTGAYVVSFTCLVGCPPGPYLHDMSLAQDGSDNLTGSGGSPAGANVYTWVITSGAVSDNTISFSVNYTATPDAVTPLTVMPVTGTIAPGGTMSGTWSDNYSGGVRSGTWVTTSGNASLSGGVAPIVSAVASPALPIAGQPTTVTANVDDSTTGNSSVTLAQYRITGGEWTSMTASDAAFDEVNENVTVALAFATPGIKEVCVRGTDAGGNISSPSGDDCVIVEVIDPLTGFVSGGGNIKSSKGKPTWTFGGNAGYVPGVGLVGQLQVVNHATKVACHYNVINNMTVADGLATVTASGKCNNGGTPTNVVFTYEDNGEPGTNDMFKSLPLAGGNIQVGGVTLGAKTFSATDSAYYNGMNVSDGLYGTGPISFTWDGAGNVTGGMWTEIVPPTVGTTYYNIVTGGTVIGGAVNLTLLRTNPSAYGPFSIVGTLVGGVLTGTAAGPYLFTATGTVFP